MDRPYLVFLGAAVILLVITAGCTTPDKTVLPVTTPNSTPENRSTPVPVTTSPGGTCSPNLTYCKEDGKCHDLATDIGNCGNCADVCPGNTSCMWGKCYCKPGYDVDGSMCIRTPAQEGKNSPVLDTSGNGCPQDMTPCSDNYCHSLQTDANNCGACGNKCPVGLLCDDDTCVTPFSTSGVFVDEWEDYRSVINYNPDQVPVDKGCPAHMTACPDGFCYDLGSNPDNCGLCGNVCPAGLVCSASTCMNPSSTVEPTATPAVAITGLTTPNPVYCPSIGLTYCDGECVNTTADKENCGSCGNVCQSPAFACCSGKCVNLNDDNANCGTCSQVCTATSSCRTGSCNAKIVPVLPKGTGLP